MDVGFGTVWEAVAAALPEQVAISEPGRRFGFAEFEERAARLAGTLAGYGVGPGDAVACYLHNTSAYLETVFAAFKLGAVPVNVNYRYTGRELADLLVDARAAALVFDTALGSRVAAALASGGLPLRVLVAAGPADDLDADRLLAGALPLTDVATSGPVLLRRPRPGTDRIFMYTGGTTGRPKGVIWQHRDLLHSISVPAYGPLGRTPPQTLDEAVEIALDAHARGLAPRTMPVVPLMHGTGLFNTIATLLVGGRVVFGPPGPLRPQAVWQTVQRERVGMLIVAGNPVCHPLVDELVRAETAGTPYELRSLRRVLSSGTTLSDDLKRALHERTAVTVVDAIASSEGGPFAFAVSESLDDLPSRFRPVPATKVFGPDDQEVLPGGIGTLAYCGPLPLGYHGDTEASARTFREIDGVRWSQPGDLVGVLADGSIRFLGRGAGVINTGGEKVHPAEVEEVLLTHPGVHDAVVVGVPDPVWGERVAAVVAVGPAGGPDPAELEAFVRTRLAGYKVPRTVVRVPDLPRTPTGKIELAWARRAAVRSGA